MRSCVPPPRPSCNRNNGTEVKEGQVNGAQLFHTYLQAVGLDSTETFKVSGRPLPMADPAFGPIKELLA